MKTLELTLLYLLKEDKVLLAMKKRGFGIGKWNGVGGKIDKDESVEEALIRECNEEIGVRITNFQKVGFLLFEEIHLDERKKMNMHIYTASEWDGDIAESEEMKPQWFKLNEIPYESMWAADRDWLHLILEGKKIRGEFTLDDNDEVVNKRITTVEVVEP
ncbi:MAG: 8-oxo-dGTP diphosphatase [Candidatus Saccharibacteria bacterium]